MFITSLRIRLSICAFLLVASWTAAAQHGQTSVEDVLDRVIAAYGGEDNLHKLGDVTQIWTVVTVTGNRHGTETRNISRFQELKVNLDYPDKSETRTLNGDDGYYSSGDGPAHKATPPQRDAMRLQLMRLYSPLVLRRKIEHLTLQTDGDQLAISLSERGVTAHYLINQDNWHIEKVAGVLSMHGRTMQFLTQYEQFKTIDGVLVHQVENTYAAGIHTAVRMLRSVTFNAEKPKNASSP